ncbi:MAG TPA: tetratricopeptide repeat protein [Terriglobales bacterium]|nr:tetratricopeptide repeat protein [Terriglobales bacterium]
METKRIDRAEIAKHLERAEKLLQKGKPADALDEYLQALAGDPENDTIRQMAADLCLSLQRTPEAVRFLGELFEHQMAAGDATHASITYKKLARFVNPTWEQKVRFGELLENSNRKLALETYENALDELVQQNRKPDALGVLRKITDLDTSEANLVRLGELCSEVGENQASAAAFQKVAEFAKASGGNPAPWIERAYTEDSSDLNVALEYGRSLLEQGQVGAAIFVLEAHVQAGGAPPGINDVYAKALLAANRLAEAEPLLWQLFEQNPSRVNEISDLIGSLLESGQDPQAVALARKLEQFQRRRGERRSFLAMMQDLSNKHRATPEMLEFMSELFNASNRESDYCQTLLKLFDLHLESGNFEKAGESLDRAAEVDPYENGHQKRLESLRGKIDDGRYKQIAARFSNASTVREEPTKSGEPMLGGAALQDLILQAEILVQYGMRSKAIERLQRIQELFPGEEEKNQDLQRLYLSAGLNPKTSSAPAPAAPKTVAAPMAAASAAQATEAADVNSLTRVSEITRKLYRQNNADAVMSAAVNEIGGEWKVSRCIVAMRKPGQSTTSTKEFCAEGTKPFEPGALAKVVATAQDVAIQRGTLTLTDALTAQEMQPVREIAAVMNLGSVLALPLSDGQDHLGLLLLTHNTTRGWRSSDIVVLKTLAEQITIALNNAGLRRLVKNLSVTDENSGLLKRASYLDLLMSETRRSTQNAKPLTVMLLQFGKIPVLLKEFGEKGVEAFMEQIGKTFASSIRQNDLAFRYGAASVALVLGETAEKEAFQAAEKLRKLIEEIRIPGKDVALPFHAGIAEAVVRANFDAVDIVTEVINRAEAALDSAIAQGNGKVAALAPSIASAAVA